VVGDYRSLPLGDLFERTSGESPGPGSGAIAALTIGLAASLVAMVARSSRGSWPDAAGVAAQAIELADRCPPLARENARVWEAAFVMLQATIEGDDSGHEAELRKLLQTSAELPVAIAETGADVAVLAVLAAKLGEVSLGADAVSAALLAHAGSRVAAHLVTVNLGTREGDELSRRAEEAESRAGQAAAQALTGGS
jgi:formiminotetrahydrofolate cyclodeaminase